MKEFESLINFYTVLIIAFATQMAQSLTLQPIPSAAPARTNPVSRIIKENWQRTYNKYSTHREYYYLELMESIVDINGEQRNSEFKIPPIQRVNTIDFKFNDEFQYITQFYQLDQSLAEKNNLCEYYRHYVQEPPVMDSNFFKLMYSYTEKKKELLLKRLQRQFDIPFENTLLSEKSVQQKKINNSKNCSNFSKVLKELKDLSSSKFSTYSESQSKCFIKIQQNLTDFYGKVQATNLEQTDKTYSFKNKQNPKQVKIGILNAKPIMKNAKSAFSKKKITLESTNGSSSIMKTSVQTPTNLLDSKNISKAHQIIKKHQKNKKSQQSLSSIHKKSLKNYSRSSNEGIKTQQNKNCQKFNNFLNTQLQAYQRFNEFKQNKRSIQSGCSQHELRVEKYSKIYKGKRKNRGSAAHSCEKIKSMQNCQSQVHPLNYKGNQIRKSLESHHKKSYIKHKKHQTQIVHNESFPNVRKTIQNCKSKIKKQKRQFTKQQESYNIHTTEPSFHINDSNKLQKRNQLYSYYKFQKNKAQ